MGVMLGYKQSEEHVRRRMDSMRAHAVSKKPVTREWLEKKYVVEELDCVMIGKLVSRDPKSVWNWLKDFGIQTRPRGVNHAHLPKDGSTFKGKKHTEKFKDRLRQLRLADGRVPYLKNGVHWLSSVKMDEHPSWKGGITPERQAFYRTREWKDAVIAVWARSDAKCERCGVHHNTTKRRGTFHVHHIVSFAVRELRAVVSNLVLLCNGCHKFVHSRRNVEKQFIGGITRDSN